MTRGGNMRGAPLFLRPSVVLGLVEGVEAIRKGLVQVPVAPIKLVDVPRRSEDPRLAKANDDSTPSGWVAPPVASEPEDWPDAPLPDHADPDLDRPEPVEDIVAEQFCSRLPVKESGLERMAARESVSQTQLVESKPAQVVDEKRSPTHSSMRAQDTAADLIPNSTIGNGIALKRAPKIDVVRLVRAHRAKDAARPKNALAPLFPAPSREECPRCGIPGWKGCEHFLPCEDGLPPAQPETADLRRVAKFTGSRQGISVLRIR